MARGVAEPPGTLFLDSEGVSKAASGDRYVRAHLAAAERRGARVVTSALVLTETLRGEPRDAKVNRILKGLNVIPVTEADAREAGRLLGGVTTRHDATVDANVAAAAVAQERPLLLLTSDSVDMRTLTSGSTHVVVAHV